MAGTIITTVILAGVVFAIIRSMIKSKRKGKSGCGCSCSSCPHKCSNAHSTEAANKTEV